MFSRSLPYFFHFSHVFWLPILHVESSLVQKIFRPEGSKKWKKTSFFSFFQIVRPIYLPICIRCSPNPISLQEYEIGWREDVFGLPNTDNQLISDVIYKKKTLFFQKSNLFLSCHQFDICKPAKINVFCGLHIRRQFWAAIWTSCDAYPIHSVRHKLIAQIHQKWIS